jgi:uncharacterized protein (TIGR03083 family)
MTMTLTRTNATAVAEVEDARFLDLLRSLRDEEWRLPTCCDGWDVRAMVLHVLGAAESASKREMLHQLRRGSALAKQRGVALVDGVNEVQIRERDHLAPPTILDRLVVAQPRFRRARRTLPAPLRAVSVPAPPPFGRVKLGTLMDRTYTRDVWMHRIDICAATGRSLEPTAEHDGFIVGDVVEEWSAAHGQPFRLTLTGPAGGTWDRGVGGESIEMDAIDFALVMAGRRTGDGLLATNVLF